MFVLLFPPAGTTLVGPFVNEDAAVAFGEAWQAENGDNLCWQVMPNDKFERRAASASAITRDQLTPGTRFKGNGKANSNHETQVYVVLNVENDESKVYHGSEWINSIREELFTGDFDCLVTNIFRLDEIGEVL